MRWPAHFDLGWMFGNDPACAARHAPDLLADRSMVRVTRAFPALRVVSLTVPFAAGWAITGTWYGGVTAFVWAGVVRAAVLQHITWSINSLCHLIDARRHPTRRYDRSTDSIVPSPRASTGPGSDIR